MIVHVRQISTSDGVFWHAETGDHEIYRRDREKAISTLLASLSLGKHFSEASALTICVVDHTSDHSVSCDMGEDCSCGN